MSRKIGDGSLAAGCARASEQELVNNEFGVARMTVNWRLRELAEQGVIVRGGCRLLRGRGKSRTGPAAHRQYR